MIETKELYSSVPEHLTSLFNKKYPWEILPEIKNFLEEICKNKLEGYTEIEKNIFVAEGVKISPSAEINGPAIIGKNTEIRIGAYIRGNVIIGENCVIGNSTELKNCIILDGAQVPHYNYVGDSILGKGAHMGAGAVCSNLKADKKNVVIHAEHDYDTALKKVGAFLGDGADVGSSCVLNPGTVIGKNTSVYPLTATRGVYPQNCIVKAADNYIERK